MKAFRSIPRRSRREPKPPKEVSIRIIDKLKALIERTDALRIKEQNFLSDSEKEELKLISECLAIALNNRESGKSCL